MVIAEQVTDKLRNLPMAAQEEVLHFVEFPAQKFESETDENTQWSDFSLAQAMSGLENDDLPAYTEADLKERWQ